MSWVNCANYANGLSFLANVATPAGTHFKQWQGVTPVAEAVEMLNPVVAPEPTRRRHTVTFMMTDGDNIQWLLNGFLGPSWYNSTDRGNVPLGWGVSPVLPDIAPPVLDYLYRNMASGSNTTFSSPSATTGSPYRDYFMSAMGAGYAFPDKLPADALSVLAAETANYVRASDLRMVQIMLMGDGDEATCL